MLSILIPEFNYDCTKLATTLSEQCGKAGIVFEIIVMDDASSQFKSANLRIQKIPGCRFVMAEQNAGLARTRNRLALMASYPYLLMIDCDAEVVDETYIQRYLDAIGKSQVVAGGIAYSRIKPEPDRLLRWFYGRHRESQTASIRNQHPYKSSLSFNLMMEKEVLLRFPYDEDFKDYGHEDSVMGFVLKQHGISVLHIDNPLIHNGLDPNDVFLSKSLKAVEKYVTNTAFQSDELVEQIKLFRIFKRIDKWRLSKCVALAFSLMKKRMERNLFSETPSLFIFDFYRLGYLCLFSSVRK